MGSRYLGISLTKNSAQDHTEKSDHRVVSFRTLGCSTGNTRTTEVPHVNVVIQVLLLWALALRGALRGGQPTRTSPSQQDKAVGWQFPVGRATLFSLPGEVRQEGPHQTKCRCLTVDLPVPRTARSKFLICKSPSLSYSLRSAQMNWKIRFGNTPTSYHRNSRWSAQTHSWTVRHLSTGQRPPFTA